MSPLNEMPEQALALQGLKSGQSALVGAALVTPPMACGLGHGEHADPPRKGVQDGFITHGQSKATWRHFGAFSTARPQVLDARGNAPRGKP